MTQAQNVAIESSQINSSGVLLTTGGGTGLSTVGTNGQVLTSNGTTLSWVTPTTTSPGGSTTQVQYNNAGAFAGSANMVFDGSTLTTLNSAYTGTLTGGTGVVNLGSGQFYKDASGNVGIGTSSPATTLDVSVASASTQVSSTTSTNRVFSRVVNGSGNFYFGIDSSTGSLFGGAAYARTIYGDGAYPMVFYTNANERMRITSAGYVGIGATTVTALQGRTYNLQLGATGTSSSEFALAHQDGNWSIWTAGPVGGGTFTLSKGNDQYYSVYSASGSAYHAWLIASSEKMRLDNSGNVFVGGTTQNTANTPVYAKTSAKAFVNFGGSNGGINAAFNVSSVTYNGTGDYTINFTNALQDNSYTLVGSAQEVSGSGLPTFSPYQTSPFTTTTARVRTALGGTSLINSGQVFAVVYR